MVLPVVREAERILYESHIDHEYLPQDGLNDFNKVSQILMFGKGSKLLEEKRVFTMQSLSGTGALRLAAELIGECNKMYW